MQIPPMRNAAQNAQNTDPDKTQEEETDRPTEKIAHIPYDIHKMGRKPEKAEKNLIKYYKIKHIIW